MSDLTHGPAPGFWRMLWKTGGMLPLFMTVFTVIFTLISANEMRIGLAYAARGVEVNGQVMDREAVRVRRDDRWQTDHYLTIRYPVQDETMEQRRKVREAVFDDSEIGSLRRVRYLPENPAKVEFKVGATLANGRTMRWFSLALGIATLAALWWKGARAVDAIRARKFGTAENVTVTDVHEARHKNTRSYRLVWVDANGVEGTSLPAGNRTRFASYPPGAQVEVFRGVSGQMWWVGDVGPRRTATTVPSVGKR